MGSNVTRRPPGGGAQGTQGVVTLQLVGKDGAGKELQSRELKLENSKDNFTRNRTDVFFLRLPDVGDIQKCRVSLLVRAAAFIHPAGGSESQQRSHVDVPPHPFVEFARFPPPQPVAGLVMDSWFLSFVEVVNESRKDKTSPVFFFYDKWRARPPFLSPPQSCLFGVNSARFGSRA